MAEHKILPARYDKVFLTLFTSPKYKDTVAMPFFRGYLHNPKLKSEDVTIGEPRLASDHLDEKHPVVDVFVNVPNGILHIEMQFFVTKDTLDRFLFYHDKIFGGQLGEGQSYTKLKKVVSLIITTEDVFATTDSDSDYLHEFVVYDKKHGITLSEKWEINILELGKLPEKSDGTVEWTWGSLLNAEEEEAFNMLATAYPEVADAVRVIKELSADPTFRQEAFAIEKAKRDWLSSMVSSKDEGFEEGIEKGKVEGIEIGRGEGIEIGRGEGIEIGEQRGIGIGREKAAIDLITLDNITNPTTIARAGGFSEDRARELIAQYRQK